MLSKLSHVENSLEATATTKASKLNWTEVHEVNLHYAAFHATKPTLLSNLVGVIILYYFHPFQHTKRPRESASWHSPLSGLVRDNLNLKDL